MISESIVMRQIVFERNAKFTFCRIRETAKKNNLTIVIDKIFDILRVTLVV